MQGWKILFARKNEHEGKTKDKEQQHKERMKRAKQGNPRREIARDGPRDNGGIDREFSMFFHGASEAQ